MQLSWSMNVELGPQFAEVWCSAVSSLNPILLLVTYNKALGAVQKLRTVIRSGGGHHPLRYIMVHMEGKMAILALWRGGQILAKIALRNIWMSLKMLLRKTR